MSFAKVNPETLEFAQQFTCGNKAIAAFFQVTKN